MSGRMSEHLEPELMTVSDKTGVGLDIWNGGNESFGGNHRGAGGHVLRLAGSVEWRNSTEWRCMSGRAEVLGGVTLGASRPPNNLVGR
jgi:hypothetical protein